MTSAEIFELRDNPRPTQGPLVRVHYASCLAYQVSEEQVIFYAESITNFNYKLQLQILSFLYVLVPHM